MQKIGLIKLILITIIMTNISSNAQAQVGALARGIEYSILSLAETGSKLAISEGAMLSMMNAANKTNFSSFKAMEEGTTPAQRKNIYSAIANNSSMQYSQLALKASETLYSRGDVIADGSAGTAARTAPEAVVQTAGADAIEEASNLTNTLNKFETAFNEGKFNAEIAPIVDRTVRKAAEIQVKTDIAFLDPAACDQFTTLGAKEAANAEGIVTSTAIAAEKGYNFVIDAAPAGSKSLKSVKAKAKDCAAAVGIIGALEGFQKYLNAAPDLTNLRTLFYKLQRVCKINPSAQLGIKLAQLKSIITQDEALKGCSLAF